MHFFISVEQFRSGENLSIGQSFYLDTFWERCKSTKQKRLAIIDYCHLNYDHFLTDGEREIIEKREFAVKTGSDVTPVISDAKLQKQVSQLVEDKRCVLCLLPESHHIPSVQCPVCYQTYTQDDIVLTNC